MPNPNSPYAHWNDAKKVCVIGAGTMGSGIAAHLANIGFEVTLLDLTIESATVAFDRARSARPPHFYVSQTADKIRLGSIQENLDWAFEADWVCEAIIEKLNAKRELFAKLDGNLKPGAMISTNTSGLQIELLAEGRSEAFRKVFLGTHFFNPPRYLKLLELIPTQETDPAAIEAMSAFLEDRVARRVVVAKDTPGFIANRFGMWAMIHAIHAAEKLRLTIEQVDAITGPFLGRPGSASFRLNDIVGLDIMQDIANNLYARCPDDPFRDHLKTPNSMAALLERGWIGSKAGQGYYRKEAKELLSLDLGTLAYRQRQEADFPHLKDLQKLPLGERIAKALEGKDEVGEYLREHLIPVLRYADYLKAEISHSVEDFDRVMMWGFGWQMGPFAMIDAIGAERLGLQVPKFYEGASMRDFLGNSVPRKSEPQYATISDFPVISSHEGFCLRDMGDGVTALALTSKMGTVNPAMLKDMETVLKTDQIQRLVLASEAKHFSLGFDLNVFVEKIAAGDMAGIESDLDLLQRVTLMLGKIPSVSAVFGYALGGGFELALGCSQMVLHPESMVGFPESKVGLLPAGAGTARMRLLNQSGGAKSLSSAAIQLSLGTTSANADDARKLGLLHDQHITIYHPDRLLNEAKRIALSAKPAEIPKWEQIDGPLMGMIDRELAELKAKGTITEYDESIGSHIRQVFVRPNSFDEALVRERQEFLQLCGKALSVARIKHMLESGKPLRN